MASASHSATSASELDHLDDNLLNASAGEIERTNTRVNILPKGWMETLPAFDHSWVAAKFFIQKMKKFFLITRQLLKFGGLLQLLL